MRQRLTAFALATGLALLVTAPVTADAPRRELTVTGSGKVSVRADTALTTLGAETTRPGFTDAIGDVAKRMNAVLSAVKALGVPEEDIKTVTYSVEARTPKPGDAGDPGRITGYRVTHLVQIKVRKIDHVAAVVEAAVAAGANAVRVVSLAVEDPSEALARARAIAVKNAKDRAWELASAAQLWLDRILTITESEMQVTPDGDAKARPGQVEIGVTVTVQYGIMRWSPYSRVLPPMP
jgi:uncharacterized protein YggE